jgi:Ca2+-binding RTX toxin-like protein
MAARRSILVPLLAAVLAGSVMSSGPALALPVSVKAPIINFERDSDTDKPNGFSSVDNTVTRFSDSMGEDLFIDDFGDETIGQGLHVFDDDQSVLVMDFGVPMRRIRLVFGNDDDCCSDPGDVGLLTVFRGGSRVGRSSTRMNRNDEADQSVAVGGVTFRRAEFAYADGTTPINLREVVDNIKLSPVCTIRGNDQRNRLGGNAQANSICGFGGRDRIRARAGDDFIHAGEGDDFFAHGGLGADTVLGGPGADRLIVADGGERDTVYGGPGNDTCVVDPADFHKGCEVLVTPPV